MYANFRSQLLESNIFHKSMNVFDELSHWISNLLIEMIMVIHKEHSEMEWIQ